MFCLADGKKDQMVRLKRNLGPARVGTYEVACLWLVLSAQTGGECPRPPERRQQQCTIEILHVVNASCAPVTLSEAWPLRLSWAQISRSEPRVPEPGQHHRAPPALPGGGPTENPWEIKEPCKNNNNPRSLHFSCARYIILPF